MSEGKPTLLQVAGVSKRFGTVQALDNVSIDFLSGEVHCLLGENGAGKSTLSRVIGGAIPPDDGQITYQGRPFHASTPADALDAGICVIWQELSVLPELSVAANVFLGKELRGRLGHLDGKTMRAVSGALLETLGAKFSSSVKAGDLSLADRQLVEIAVALNRDAKVIIMDEATSSLSADSAVNLFRVVRKLRDQGKCIIYITHELEEVFALGDRATILKDGVLVQTADVADLTRDDIVRAMVGRDLDQMFPERDGGPFVGDGTRRALRVDSLTLPPFFYNVSFDVGYGEIVGLAGLIGAGRTALARALFGAAPGVAGRLAMRGGVEVAGSAIRCRAPSDGLREGIAYVPEDRKRDGLALGLSVKDNLVMPRVSELARWGLTRPKVESEAAQGEVDRMGIRLRSLGQPVSGLSGGNQQKVVLGKWLATGCQILILDEPTRGIDVGAKAEIYNILRELADAGLGILLISSELPEVLGLSDRILVMRRGRIVAEAHRGDASEESIIRSAMGVE